MQIYFARGWIKLFFFRLSSRKPFKVAIFIFLIDVGYCLVAEIYALMVQLHAIRGDKVVASSSPKTPVKSAYFISGREGNSNSCEGV